MADISVEELISILRAGSLSAANFGAVVTHIVLPEYHDAVWVALDNNELTGKQLSAISDFVAKNPSVIPEVSDVRVPCLLFFMVAWRLYREENYQKAHQGAVAALGVAKKYGPAQELSRLIQGHIEQSRIPPLTLNESGRVNPIQVNQTEELEINPKWL